MEGLSQSKEWPWLSASNSESRLSAHTAAASTPGWPFRLSLTSRVPVRSPTCLTAEFACRKSSVPFGFMRASATTFKLNRLADELTNTANSFLQLMRLATIPMSFSNGRNLLSKWVT